MKLGARGERGMTMVELVAAMAVLSLVMGSIVLIYTQALRIYTNTQNQAVVQSAARLAMEAVEKEIRGAKELEFDSQTGQLLNLVNWSGETVKFEIYGEKALYRNSGGTARFIAQPIESISITKDTSTEQVTVIITSVQGEADFTLNLTVVTDLNR